MIGSRVFPSRVRAWVVSMAVVVLASSALVVGAPAPAAQALGGAAICTGFAQCNKQQLGNGGYESVYTTSFWNMIGGHNCTNYVAYRLGRDGVSRFTITGQGNAYEWGNAAVSKGISVDKSNPRPGDVAWFDRSVAPGFGHVAYVESVDVQAGTITVSEDNAGGDFDWRKYRISEVSGFIHVGKKAPSVPRVASDFNGDGKSDLVWYESWNHNGAAQVLLSNGSGFSGSEWLSGYSRPDWAGVGDFNGDGRSDLAWYESWNNNGVKVLLSNGSGFSSSTWLSGYGKPDWAGVGDFNGDGKSDLVWYESWNHNGAAQVLLSNGSGFSGSEWLSGYSRPDWAGVGDFNGDGKSDLAWYEAWNNNGVKVLLSNGSGFSSSTWLTGYGKPDWAGVGDFNGDGKSDLAWYEAWNHNGAAQVLLSTSTGFSGAEWLKGYGKPDWANGAAVVSSSADPRVQGRPAIGTTLTVASSGWYPGTVSLRYQWLRNGQSIPGATAASYPVVDADAQKSISVTVTAESPGLIAVSRTSAPVSVPARTFASTPTPTISGTVKVGATLSAKTGTWSPRASFAYQWLRDGKTVRGATSKSYTLVAADAGSRITVRVTGTRTGYAAVTKTSAATSIVKR